MACLACHVCDLSEPEDLMLVCDACERGYHTTCCTPPLAHVPDGRWICQLCVRCVLCGTRGGPGVTWSTNYDVCSRCEAACPQRCTVCDVPVPTAPAVKGQRPVCPRGRSRAVHDRHWDSPWR